MAHWVAETGKQVFLAQSFSQSRNLGLHSQIGWAVSKTLVGVLVWSLFYIFSISYNNFSDVSNSCFSSSLTWSQLTCLYFLMQRILPKASWGPVVSEQNNTFFSWKSISHQPDSCMLYLFCTTSLVKQILWPVACYYIHMHVHGMCWSCKEPCAALGFQHFPLAEWCSVSPQAGASETYFFKHWWWWCQWHWADHKGPLGRTLLPEHSRALPALPLSRAEVY